MDDKLYKKINEMSPDELINIIDNSNMYSAEAVELANYRLSYLTTPMNDKTDTTTSKSNEVYENKSTVKTAIQKNGIFNAYAKMFKNYANFKGRSSRGDFWYAGLMNGIIMLLFYVIVLPPLISMLDAVIIGNGNSGTPLQIVSLLVGGISYIVWLFASLIPSLALSVRRLHDIGKSGWWYFISCVPIVGVIILLVYMSTKGNDTTNEYGENPLSSKEKVSTKGIKIGFIALIVLAVLSIVGACFSEASFTNTSLHAEGNIEFVDDNGDVILDKYDIVSAEAQYTEIQGWYIELKLNKQGQERFADATERLATYTDYIGSMGIFIDNELITSSAVNEKIDSNIISITGNFTKEHAEVLASKIMYADFAFGGEYNDGLDEEYEAEYEEKRKNGKLLVGTNAEYPPFEYVDNNEIVGFDIDLMREIGKIIGFEIEFENCNFDSLINDVAAYYYDCAIAGITITEERLQAVSFSDIYATIEAMYPNEGILSYSFAIAINNDNDDLRVMINNAISTLKNNGTLDRLIEKYGLNETIYYDENGNIISNKIN